jgi:hypothetical protein
MVKAIWMVLLVMGSALSQEVRLEMGFRGEMVAQHWNPLRLIRRDMGPATLTLEFDQGTLRQGAIPVFYKVNLRAAQGLDVFEDDVYIPFWRAFTWKLADDDEVFASGSFDRQLVNTQPIDLIISKTPENYLRILGETTRVIQADDLLPKRLAAYDGVNTLLMDGSIPMPSLEAISSAAAGGVLVLFLSGSETYSYEAINLLAPNPRQRLGAGWIVRTTQDGLKASLALLPRLEQKGLQEVIFTSQDMFQNAPVTTLLIGLGAYVVLVLIGIRFIGTAGLATAFLLTGLASMSAWMYLRPAPQQVSSQSLFINAGKLAQVNSLYQITQLPQGQLQLSMQAHPDSQRTYIQGEDLELDLERWSQETLRLKPRLTTATLLLEGNLLSNQSEVDLQDVYVSGLGQQKNLVAGQSLELIPGEENSLYENLLPMLPIGTVLARHQLDVHIAIPSLDFAVQP